MFSGLGDTDFSEAQSKEKFFVPDTHLDVPLMQVKLEKIQSSMIKQVQGIFRHDSFEADPTLVLFDWIVATTTSLCVTTMTEVSIDLHNIKQELNVANTLEEAGLNLNHWDTLLEDVIFLPEAIAWWKSCRDFLTKLVWETAEDTVHTSKKKKSSISELYSLSAMLIGVDRDTLVLSFNNRFSIATRDFLLMISDIANQRYLTMLAAHLGWLLKVIGYPTVELITQVYQGWDEILKTTGNQGYNLVKFHEPLCTTALHFMARKNQTEIGLIERFRNVITADYEEKAKELGVPRGSAIKLITILQDSENIDAVVQIFGLYRQWGHPHVRSSEGIAANRKIACPEKTISADNATQLTRAFKELIFEAYFRKEGKYPNFTWAGEEGLLYDILLTGKPLRVGELYEQWDQVTVKGTIDPYLNLNILDLIQDKACGVPRSEVLKELRAQKRSGWKQRRVLTKFMSEDTPDPKEFLTSIDTTEGGLDDEDLTIGVTPKERELKVKPRLFSLMSFPLKLYFGLTEHLLADTILPYVKEITMTDGAIELQKKMYHATNKMVGHNKEVLVVINLDFEKWNLNFRECNTIDCFKILDQLFGWDKVFSRTHDFFKRTLFYCADNQEYPSEEDFKNLNNNYIWSQLGGCEGLRQKGWTLITVAAIRLVLIKMGVKFALLGQGDNQALVLTLSYDPEKESISKVHVLFADILINMGNFFRDIRLPLKIEETWSSSNVFAYGKLFIVNGAPRPMSLKRISRCYPLSNEDYPGLFTSIASIFANAQAATASDYNFIVSYIVAMTEATNAILMHLSHSVLLGEPLKRGKSLITTVEPFAKMIQGIDSNIMSLCKYLTWTSASLGGYPFQNPLTFLTKGFSDQVTLDLLWGYKRWQYLNKKQLASNRGLPSDDVATSVALAIICPVLKTFSIEDLGNLLSAPAALNVFSGPQKAAVLRAKARDVLSMEHVNKNKDLLNLIRYFNKNEEQLLMSLHTMEPFHARLAADIYAASPSGVTEALFGKFDTTKTLRNVAREENIGFLFAVKRSEIMYYTGVLFQLENADRICLDFWANYHDSDCMMKLVKELRYRSWKREIIGITTPHPAHFLRRITGEDLSNYTLPEQELSLRVDRSLVASQALIFRAVGPFPPYLGADRVEGISQHKDYQIKSSLGPIRASVDNLRVVGWFVNPESKLAKSLLGCVSAYTDFDPSVFLSLSSTDSSNWVRRYNDRFSKHGGFLNTLYGLSTNVCLSTSNHTNVATASSIHYGAMNVYAIACLGLDFSQGQGKQLSRYKVACFCNDVIAESSIVLPEVQKEIIFPKLGEESVLWRGADVLSKSISVHLQSKVSNLKSSVNNRLEVVSALSSTVLRSITNGYNELKSSIEIRHSYLPTSHREVVVYFKIIGLGIVGHRLLDWLTGLEESDFFQFDLALDRHVFSLIGRVQRKHLRGWVRMLDERRHWNFLTKFTQDAGIFIDFSIEDWKQDCLIALIHWTMRQETSDFRLCFETDSLNYRDLVVISFLKDIFIKDKFSFKITLALARIIKRFYDELGHNNGLYLQDSEHLSEVTSVIIDQIILADSLCKSKFHQLTHDYCIIDYVRLTNKIFQAYPFNNTKLVPVVSEGLSVYALHIPQTLSYINLRESFSRSLHNINISGIRDQVLLDPSDFQSTVLTDYLVNRSKPLGFQLISSMNNGLILKLIERKVKQLRVFEITKKVPLRYQAKDRILKEKHVYELAETLASETNLEYIGGERKEIDSLINTKEHLDTFLDLEYEATHLTCMELHHLIISAIRVAKGRTIFILLPTLSVLALENILVPLLGIDLGSMEVIYVPAKESRSISLLFEARIKISEVAAAPSALNHQYTVYYRVGINVYHNIHLSRAVSRINDHFLNCYKGKIGVLKPLEDKLNTLGLGAIFSTDILFLEQNLTQNLNSFYYFPNERRTLKLRNTSKLLLDQFQIKELVKLMIAINYYKAERIPLRAYLDNFPSSVKYYLFQRNLTSGGLTIKYNPLAYPIYMQLDHPVRQQIGLYTRLLSWQYGTTQESRNQINQSAIKKKRERDEEDSARIWEELTSLL